MKGHFERLIPNRKVNNNLKLKLHKNSAGLIKQILKLKLKKILKEFLRLLIKLEDLHFKKKIICPVLIMMKQGRLKKYTKHCFFSLICNRIFEFYQFRIIYSNFLRQWNSANKGIASNFRKNTYRYEN